MTTPQTADRPTILAVDDSADIIAMISGLLKDLYKVKVANSGKNALAIAKSSAPNLILLDILMPEMDGYEVFSRLKEDPATRNIPVIFLSAKTESEDEEKGFELGAVDYIAKPINPVKLLARVKTHTALNQARMELQEWNNNLKRKVINNAGIIREKISDLNSTSSLSAAFSSLLEMMDPRYFTHANSVSKLAGEAARRMALDSQTVKDINLAALLHDIGKLGLGENSAKLPPDEMSDGELQEYRQHPLRSQCVLERIEPLQHVALMIRHHHEAFDGSGFPDRLKGDDIPLGAQLIGIADYIDHAAQCVSIGQAVYLQKKLTLSAGTLFDPRLIEYFTPSLPGLIQL